MIIHSDIPAVDKRKQAVNLRYLYTEKRQQINIDYVTYGEYKYKCRVKVLGVNSIEVEIYDQKYNINFGDLIIFHNRKMIHYHKNDFVDATTYIPMSVGINYIPLPAWEQCVNIPHKVAHMFNQKQINQMIKSSTRNSIGYFRALNSIYKIIFCEKTNNLEILLNKRVILNWEKDILGVYTLSIDI